MRLLCSSVLDRLLALLLVLISGMGFLSTFLGILGFGIGVPIGLLLGFFLFVYDVPDDVEVMLSLFSSVSVVLASLLDRAASVFFFQLFLFLYDVPLR